MNLSKRVSWFHWKWPKTEFKNQMEFLLEKTLQKLAHVHLVIVLQWFHQQQVCTLLPTVSAPWHFGKRHFGTDISSPRHFGTCTFRPCRCTHIWTFHLHGNFNTRTFWHGDILAQGIFIHIVHWITSSVHGGFGTDISAHVLLCLKCPCTKMSPCQNVHCQKILVPKRPCAEKSLYRKVLIPKRPQRWKSMCWNTYSSSAEISRWWNVCAKMSLAKMLGVEMVIHLLFAAHYVKSTGCAKIVLHT